MIEFLIVMLIQPLIVTLDAEKLYGGWFWTSVSSIPCYSVMIVANGVSDPLRDNEIQIRLGYPDEKHCTETDPRNNQDIIYRLIEDGKAK